MPLIHSRKINAAPSSCAGRKRKAVGDAADNIVVKQRRIDHSEPHCDQVFLEEASKELSKLKTPRNSQRREVVGLLLRYLPTFHLPSQSEAHFFDDNAKARQFMTTKEQINAPVFVNKGCNYSMIDSEAKERPIDQLFDFLPNSNEEEDYDDQSATKSEDYEATTTIGDIRERFQEHNGFVKSPVNFTDIPNPMIDHGVPSFVQSINCMALHNIMRTQCDVLKQDICDCPTADEKGTDKCQHFITQTELVQISTAWRHWQGTCMLSEAGYITAPHWDQFGLGTWISCLEGEIGFAWLSHPSDSERSGWQTDIYQPKGNWLFKVLRPGNALYMPPGTVHFVFRRPHGKQTLGFSGHLVRRNDLTTWLKTLGTEMRFALIDDSNETPYLDIVPSLLGGASDLLVEAKERGFEKQYGGKTKIDEVRKLIKKLEKQIVRFESK